MEQKKKKVKKPLGIARLIPGKCIACGARCESTCKVEAITMNDAGVPAASAVFVFARPMQLRFISHRNSRRYWMSLLKKGLPRRNLKLRKWTRRRHRLEPG